MESLGRTWVYHPYHEAKIVSVEEADLLFKQGWYDTPAKFPQEGKSYGDFNNFTKEQLARYAKEVFGVVLDKRKKEKTLISEIEALHDSNGTD